MFLLFDFEDHLASIQNKQNINILYINECLIQITPYTRNEKNSKKRVRIFLVLFAWVNWSRSSPTCPIPSMDGIFTYI